ncbi:MAG: type II toxin-antitoxin system prevent-host-death family antitoxin [Alphaproteobacteria bacterium]|nr:type II toxin-antitoxin system prevent-host-death family antitoxin [Alphaproteobacteria bacterium]
MEKAISAAEANRQFSRILRSVRDGESYVVTAHGRPVARITPVRSGTGDHAARTELLERLRREAVVDVGPWSRDELYQR